MGQEDVQHFLVIYDIPAGKARVRSYETDYDAALDAYTEIEREHQDRSDLDIVLLSADSIETVKRTHSSYFDTETFERFLPDGVLAR